MFPARPASAGPVTPSGARATRDAADFIAFANTAPAAAAAVAKPPPISLVEQLRAKEEEALRKKRARAAKEAAGGDLTAVPDDLLSALSFSESTAAADAARRGEHARWDARVRAKREAMRSITVTALSTSNHVAFQPLAACPLVIVGPWPPGAAWSSRRRCMPHSSAHLTTSSSRPMPRPEW